MFKLTLLRSAFVLALLGSLPLSAAVFLVPEDAELVRKSPAIVVGRVTDATPRDRQDGHIETVYSVRVERALKGQLNSGEVIQVVSPGGVSGERATIVVGAAHFAPTERILLFLSEDGGQWTPTDMTLGKFRFVTSTGGQALLVRDEEDIVGFDREMRTHVERIRRQTEFLTFIEEKVRGRSAKADYFVAPQDVVSLPAPEGTGVTANATTYTASSYAIQFNGGQYAGRWPESRMSATTAKPFYKNIAQNATGLADGGVGVINNALAAWMNDCQSYVNTPYGGTTPLLKDGSDGVNVVVWNDPGGHIAGSWTGSGVIATAFMTASGSTFSFGGASNWIGLSDSDVVFQNGLTGTESFVATAFTHEIGHALGLRHSNLHFDGTACQATDECTSAAIMNSSVGVRYDYVLQSWDLNAIRALYPSTCTATPPPAPAGVTATATSSSSVTVSWAAAAGATSYKVFRRTAPGSYVQIASGIPATSYADGGCGANSACQYVVRATNSSGDSAESNTDFATTVTFTDPTLTGRTIRLVHWTELRTAVNALRSLAGLSAFSFSAPAPAVGVAVRKAHIDGLRSALNEARGGLGAPAVAFAEAITTGSTRPKASHLTELRSGVE